MGTPVLIGVLLFALFMNSAKKHPSRGSAPPPRPKHAPKKKKGGAREGGGDGSTGGESPAAVARDSPKDKEEATKEREDKLIRRGLPAI